MQESVLSIIIPVFNVENYIEDCFQSLNSQTQQNFEVILVDDGSTDSSGKRCDEFAKTRDNTLVIHTKNRGLLLARRRGINESSGDYLAFLDSDDCISSDFVVEIERVLQNNYPRPDLIAFDLSQGPDISYSGVIRKPGLSQPGFYSGDSYRYVKEVVCKGFFNNLANKVIKRELIDFNDDYLRYAGLMHGEDWLQIIPIVDKATSVFYLDKSLYFYRSNPNSSTYKFRISQLRDLSKVLDRMVDYSKKWGDPYLQCARVGVCRHLFKMIASLARSKDYSAEKKLDIMQEISVLIKHFCGNGYKLSLPKLRIDYLLTVRFASAKKYRLSMAVSKLSAKLYDILCSSK